MVWAREEGFFIFEISLSILTCSSFTCAKKERKKTEGRLASDAKH